MAAMNGARPSLGGARSRASAGRTRSVAGSAMRPCIGAAGELLGAVVARGVLRRRGKCVAHDDRPR